MKPMLKTKWNGLLLATLAGLAQAAPLATVTVQPAGGEAVFVAEGVVEAVRTSTLAAQVTGSVTALTVREGDAVRAGQLLVKVDPRLARQQEISNQAQDAAAQAQLSIARSEFERKRRLYDKKFISQSALEQAESEYKSAEAQTRAQQAQTDLANVQTGMHVISAPYAGVVAQVMTELGALVAPDKPLLTVYDPRELRVAANVPQSQLASLKKGAAIEVEIPGAPDSVGRQTSTRMTVLPVADAASHVVQVRVLLPQSSRDLSPGMFARVRLPLSGVQTEKRIRIPETSIIRRSELTAVYVLGGNGRPQLRQVRLGQTRGAETEVFSGLQPGEKIVVDPLVAARMLK